MRVIIKNFLMFSVGFILCCWLDSIFILDNSTIYSNLCFFFCISLFLITFKIIDTNEN